MSDLREAAANSLLVCIERGDPFPRRPEPADLWEGCRGNGYMALLVMLDFIKLEQIAKVVDHERAMKRYRDRRDLAELVA